MTATPNAAYRPEKSPNMPGGEQSRGTFDDAEALMHLNLLIQAHMQAQDEAIAAILAKPEIPMAVDVDLGESVESPVVAAAWVYTSVWVAAVLTAGRYAIVTTRGAPLSTTAVIRAMIIDPITVAAESCDRPNVVSTAESANITTNAEPHCGSESKNTSLRAAARFSRLIR